MAILLGVSLPLAAVLYVLFWPDNVQKSAGWAWSGLTWLWSGADRKAVAYKVQGDVNAARARLLRNAPDDVMEGKLKVKWRNAEGAEAVLREGEVVVFMRRADHHEENVANAMMAYLPKAVVPRARRYLPDDTMRAADLTLAKSVLTSAVGSPGALDAFMRDHLEPACEADEAMQQQVRDMDEIDLHGWLVRIMLPEFRRLGDAVFPGEPDERCVKDAEAFCRWLHTLAAREPGDETIPLAFDGQYLRVAIVLVANRFKLAEKGTDPYRKMAKRLIYSGTTTRSTCSGATTTSTQSRRSPIHWRRMVGSRWRRSTPIGCRADFKKRKLNKERAIVVRLRPHVPGEGAADPGEDLPPIEIDAFDPEVEIQTADQRVPQADGSPTLHTAGDKE